mmetsp:Transcript_15207/g.21692  ORF Transcript_15207/g.21692 Transcript_15207/m.21692 type:complete len:107 (+) Transcript_15207:385-705(+)
MELVKATRDKINKCVIDGDIDNSENNQVAIIRKNPSTVDINDEDIPDLVTLMGELAASSKTNNYELRALINTTFQADGRAGEGKYFNMRTWSYSNVHKTTNKIRSY